MKARLSPRVIGGIALAIACGGAFAQDSVETGRRVYEQQCRACHGGAAPADLALGPSLAGVMGARAGTRSGGVHSRAMLESRITWDRDSLRGFLSSPRRVLPEAMMPAGLTSDADIEPLLDYLESLR